MLPVFTSVRSLLRAPGFAAACVVTLAVGIGASSAVFSVVNGVLLKPLPYPGAERLTRLFFHPADNPNPPYRLMSFPDYQDITAASRSFEATALFGNARPTLTGSGDPQVLNVARVTASALQLLGITPMLGRAFEPADDRAGAPPVIMLSHSLWQRRFGSDRSVVDRTITLDGAPVTVIGVLPPDAVPPADLQLGSVRDAWVPLAPFISATDRKAYRFSMYGRLRAGVTPPEARRELEDIAGRLAEAYPGSNKGVGFGFEDARDQLVQGSRRLLGVIMAAVGLILLIACANVANLLVARGTTRRREVAIRASLGASRAAILKESLTESLALAVGGGLLGLVLAWAGVHWFSTAAAARVPRLAHVRLDVTVLVMTALVATASGMLSGLLPALAAVREGVAGTLAQAGQRITAGRQVRRLRATLLAGQVAITVPLLAGSGLLLHSFWKLSRVSTGFDPRDVVTVTVGLNGPVYRDPAAVVHFYDAALERISRLPGVAAAGATTNLPLNGGFECVAYQVDGVAEQRKDCAELRVTTPGYAGALVLPVLAGRYFDATDRADGRRVAVVSRSFAERLWTGGDPLGRQVRAAGDTAWRTVVGVIGDVRHKALAGVIEPEIHVPLAQWAGPRFLTLAVRAPASTSLADGIRRAIWSVDASIPVPDVATMTAVVSNSIALERLRSFLLFLCGAVALVLAVAGIYGVTAYLVGERRREIGIRLALGAAVQRVRAMILRQSLAPVVAGLVFGLPLAWAAGRVVARFLFGVTPWDPATFGAIAAVLAAAAWLGTSGPLARASRVDPVEALRHD